MAAIPYFVLSPTAILALISLWRGPDKTVPTPNEDWKEATLDIIIPARNEEENIVLCLAALETQTFPINKITLIDDNSSDNTLKYATEYLENSNLNVEILHRDKQLGKTASLYHGALGDADAVMIIDADTVLISDNYIESLVQELYKNAGVASASGRIYSLHERDLKTLEEKHKNLLPFFAKYPKANYLNRLSWLSRIAKGITNAYRDVLYLYLESFIYKGETDFCGSIPNTIGCAAIYKRDRLKAVYDKYMPSLGFNFTDAEDTFIGFAFIDEGYRNALVPDVFARTQEPEIHKLFRQIFIWSSGFLQTCYYFQHIVASPLKSIRKSFKKAPVAPVESKRKISEAYRQSWGVAHSQKYGRPMGWYILTTTIEKFTFPIFLAVMIYFQHWEAVLYTLIAESLLVCFVVGGVSKKGYRLKNLLKTLAITPIRYILLLFDLVVIAKFLKDVAFGTKGSWRI